MGDQGRVSTEFAAIWRDRDHLESALLDWVTWFDTNRTHESIDDLTPLHAEHVHHRHRADLAAS